MSFSKSVQRAPSAARGGSVRRRLPITSAILALAVLSASPTWAQSGRARDEAFPFDQLTTSVVGVSTPADWRFAFVNMPGFIVEFGELVPQDQTVEQWRDLLSYSTAPAAATPDVTTPDATFESFRPNCEAFASFQTAAPDASAGEQWFELACLARPGAPNTLADRPLEIYVYRALRAGDAQFQFFRAWRGTSADFDALLARHGAGPANLPARASSEQLSAQGQAIAALTGPWRAELRTAFEVCDLAGAPCASLNHTVDNPLPGQALAGVAVRGDNTNPQEVAQFFRRMLGRQAANFPADALSNMRVMQGAQPRTHNFRSLSATAQYGASIGLANKGVGGLAMVGDDRSPSPPARAARLRAYLLKVGRLVIAMPNGPPADALTFDLWLDR